MRSSIAMMCFLLISTPGRSAVLHVPSDQPTIQGAINASGSGDTIRIAAGRFNEDLLIDHKTVHLIGAGSDSTILDGAHTNFYYDVFMKGPMDPPTTIRDMTISGNSGILLLDSSRVVVEYCCFRNFRTSRDLFVISSQGSGLTTSATIRFCRFHDNAIGTTTTGLIFKGYYTNLWFEGNLVVNNSAPNDAGIECHGCAATIINNTIIHNGFGSGAILLLSSVPNGSVVMNNIVCFNSTIGIRLFPADTQYFQVEYNDVYGNPGGNFVPDSIGFSTTNMSLDPLIIPPDYLPDASSPVIGAASDGGDMGIRAGAPPCAPEPTCGDGVAEEAEQCDDGNLVACDGCSENCLRDGLSGDANGTGTYTSADIIYLVNYVFKSGPPPVQSIAAGDTNCDGQVTAADIIRLVPWLFIGGRMPCRLCDSPLWPGL